MAGEEPLIPASIISVFELLPQASIFAEALVTTVVKLEVALRHRPSSSPYRDPLVRYFNRYPSAAADYFLAGSSLTDPSKCYTSAHRFTELQRLMMRLHML